MSHPRLCLRTSLGDRAVSQGSPRPIGTHVVRDRRVSPYLVSRVATPIDDTGEQARSVNLLETWELVLRRGQWGNPLAVGSIYSLASVRTLFLALRSELCSIATGVTEKVTKTFHSFLGSSSPLAW